MNILSKPKVTTFLVVAFVATVLLPGAHASVEGPTITSPANLKVRLPAVIKVNKPLEVSAETTKYQLGGNVTDVKYTWKVESCGVTQIVEKNLSNNPTAYKHTYNGVFTQGCKIKIRVDIASFNGATLYDNAGFGEINAPITLTNDITLTGPSTVKVGTTGSYVATFVKSTNQKTNWFSGISCNIVHISASPMNGAYETGFTFGWKPKKVKTCTVNATGVYTTKDAYDLITSIEYAKAVLPVKSVN